MPQIAIRERNNKTKQKQNNEMIMCRNAIEFEPFMALTMDWYIALRI